MKNRLKWAPVCQGGRLVDRFCTHCWDVVAERVGLVMKSAREMLPQGYWPREERVDAPPTRSSGRRPAPDPGRFAFLLNVGQIIQRLRVESLGIGYEAFVFRAPSGRRLALVESPRSINALYIFNADDPSWESVASRTRYEVTTARPPQFVRKLYHTPSFQDRVAKLLAEA